jgi:hypothetical protein
MRVSRRATWPRWGKYSAKECRRCGCHGPASLWRPCTMQLPDGVSTAQCVPAGAFRFPACSRCLAGMPLAGELVVDALEREGPSR